MPDLARSFQRLSEFYLGCVQEEGLRLLNIRSNRRGDAFIVPSFGREAFLHDDLERLELPQLSSSQAEFIGEAANDQGPNTTSRDRLFYGFPVHVDRERKVSPVFFAEVEVESAGDSSWALARREETPPYVNHHLFRKEGYYPEQIADIQDRIERHSGPFQEKLGLILGYLDGVPTDRDWRQVSPLPSSASPGLYPSPLLFQSTYSSYTYNLERDLSALQKYDFLQEDVAETALAPYFDSSRGQRRQSGSPPAEVLRLNGEQDEGIRAALEEPLSAVTGPPGTGKSQVVVNLLSQAAMSGDAVLFASKNNKAVDVVRERMREILGEEFDFVLRLGSRGRMDEMEEEMEERFRRLSERREELTGRFTREGSRRLQQEIDALRDQIAELKRRHEAYQSAKDERRAAEEGLPDTWTDPEAPSPDALPLRPLRSALDKAKALAGEKKMGLLLWVKQLLFRSRMLEDLRETADGLTGPLHRDIQEDVYVEAYGDDDFESVARVLSQLMSYRKWAERCVEEKEALDALEELFGDRSTFEERLGELKDELTGAYRKRLRNVWVGRVARNLPSTRRKLQRYFEAVQGVRNADRSGYREALDRLESALTALSEVLPVWVVTNLSVRNALPLRPGLFDLAVVDEASQCDIASAVPLLYRAKRSVIIGDPNQLRHITSIGEEEESRIAQRSNASELTPRWSYVNRSLFDLAERALNERSERPILLRNHYRSHPEIIGFSNQRFYNGQLRPMRSAESVDLPEQWRGVRWFDVQGEVPEGIRSAYNDREIRGVLWLLGKWAQVGILGEAGLSVGVVTPFRAQADRLQDRVKRAEWWEELQARSESDTPVEVKGPTIGTAHRFQGDERDLVIFSPVVAPGIDEYTEQWVATTDQLLNVAVTRARASLQVMGHLGACRRSGGSLAPFADYVSSRSLIEEKRVPASR
jgi:hypothetical protein